MSFMSSHQVKSTFTLTFENEAQFTKIKMAVSKAQLTEIKIQNKTNYAG